MTPCPGSDEAPLMIAVELTIAVSEADAPPAVRCCGVSLALAAGERRDPRGPLASLGWVPCLGWPGAPPKGWVLQQPQPLHAAGGARGTAVWSEADPELCRGAGSAGPCKAPSLGCCIRLAICRGLWPLPELQVLCLWSSEGLHQPQWLGWSFSRCW